MLAGCSQGTEAFQSQAHQGLAPPAQSWPLCIPVADTGGVCTPIMGPLLGPQTPPADPGVGALGLEITMGLPC